MVVAIVSFFRGKGYPANVIFGSYPGDTAWIPARFWLGHRRRLPVPAVVYVDPVPIVVSRVAEGLIRDPGIVAVPFRPAARGKGSPIVCNLGRLPHVYFPSLVGYAFPPAVSFQLISVIPQGFGQVLGRLHGRCVTLGPYFITVLVPCGPSAIDGSVTGTDLGSVGDNRGPAGRDLVLGIVCDMDEVNRA